MENHLLSPGVTAPVSYRGERLTTALDSYRTGCPVIKVGSHVENQGT